MKCKIDDWVQVDARTQYLYDKKGMVVAEMYEFNYGCVMLSAEGITTKKWRDVECAKKAYERAMRGAPRSN